MLGVKPWRLDALLLLVAGILLSGSVGGLLYHLLAALHLVDPDDRFYQFLVGTVSLHVVAVFMIAFFLREHELSWKDAFDLGCRGVGKVVGLAALVGLVALPVTWLLNHLSFRFLSQFHVEPPIQPAVETFRATVSVAQQAVFGFVTVLVAPVVEELLFRGIFYTALRRYARRALALWGVSMLFAAIHQSDVTFVPLTFLAVMLTLLYEETGTLLAPIMVHGIFNLTNFCWLLAERQTM